MFLVFGFFLEFVVWEVSAGRIIAGLQGPHPPPASYGVNKEAFDKDVINSVNFAWSAGRKNDDGYIWEKSGLFEGDIMFYKDDYKNGIIDKSRRWKNATIPFYIEEKHFSDEEIRTILLGIKEFHKKTCLRLRPYKTDDENWIIITGNSSGCWSSLGMKGKGGQHLNLNSPKCVKKGVVMHEM